MAKVPNSSENHGEPGVIGGANDFIVLDGTAGLDDGGGACLSGLQQAIGKWEKSIGGHNGAMHKRHRVSCRPGRILTFADRYAGGINA